MTISLLSSFSFFFFFNDTATTEIYTLSLHDALPSSASWTRITARSSSSRAACDFASSCRMARDRKSTRLNSCHLGISYAVFCLKKKKGTIAQIRRAELEGIDIVRVSCPDQESALALKDIVAEVNVPIVFFFLMKRQPPRSTLFPYTTLFRFTKSTASASTMTPRSIAGDR